jgi:hypothetical protein
MSKRSWLAAKLASIDTPQRPHECTDRLHARSWG